MFSKLPSVTKPFAISDFPVTLSLFPGLFLLLNFLQFEFRYIIMFLV